MVEYAWGISGQVLEYELVLFVTESESFPPISLHVRTQKKDSCLQARKRALTGTEVAGTLILDSRTAEK